MLDLEWRHVPERSNNQKESREIIRDPGNPQWRLRDTCLDRRHGKARKITGLKIRGVTTGKYANIQKVTWATPDMDQQSRPSITIKHQSETVQPTEKYASNIFCFLWFPLFAGQVCIKHGLQLAARMLGCRTLRRSDLGQSSAALERVKSLSESGGKVAHATPEPGVLEAILSGQQTFQDPGGC